MNLRRPHPGLGSCLIAASVTALVVGAGCKKSDPIVGVWKNQMGLSVTFDPDKTFRQEGGKSPLAGTWSLADKTLSLIVTSVDGRPMDEVLDERIADTKAHRPSEATPDKIAQAKADSKKPMILKLSDDGSTLSFAVALPPGLSADKVEFKKDTSK